MNHVEGNLLSLKSGILVHGCNCQGAMGAGIALGVRKQLTPAWVAYSDVHRTVGLKLGDVVAVGGWAFRGNAPVERHLQAVSRGLPNELIVVNAMTQDSFGRDRIQVDYDALEAAFHRVKVIARDSGLSVHVPLIGCGLAGGSWDEVSKRIERALGSDIDVTLWTLPAAPAVPTTGSLL